MMAEWRDKIQAAAAIISEAEALLVCAGAGMGVDSGLPDFRGSRGFWSAYPPYRKLGLDFYDLANPQWFISDPFLAWGFYGHRLGLYRRTDPHPGFALLRQWAAGKSRGHFVFTSNVDGQFQRAGFAEEHVCECHGSIHHLQCAVGCPGPVWPVGGQKVAVDEETMRARPPLPNCPFCGRLARPNVLMFGDWGWQPQRSQGQGLSFRNWLDAVGDSRLAIVECGAGTAVPSVRRLSEQLLARPGTGLVRINAREADVPPGQVGLDGSCLPVLKEIAALIPTA
jgi:NAD-dependent SIR2 family protein deacetylase